MADPQLPSAGPAETTVVGRPAFAIPPSALAVIATGDAQPLSTMGRPVTTNAEPARRAPEQIRHTWPAREQSMGRRSPTSDLLSFPINRSASSPSGMAGRCHNAPANPGSPGWNSPTRFLPEEAWLSTLADRMPFGEHFIRGPLFEVVCHNLEKKDWHMVAQCSRPTFNSLALYKPLPNPKEPDVDWEMPEVSTEPVLHKEEHCILGALAFIVWVIIFFGGRNEWEYKIDRDCSRNCTTCGPGDLSFVKVGCRMCDPGFINGGMKCYSQLDDLPPVKTGAALGGDFYYCAIIAVQAFGAFYEILLLCRLRRRHMIVGKEMCVALTALSVEILRMVLVDLFLLRTYFYNHSYKIFNIDPVEAMQQLSSPTSQYVVAWSHLNVTDLDLGKCSLFTRDSPLLDFDESFGWGTGGHPRFRTIGWVIGGEFAMYYFFAAVINEVADNLFIIPVGTLRYGFKCKIISIILELFQLGALFPAAAFTHGECLVYHNPLNADLSAIRYTIVTWGYFLWGSVFVIGLATIVVGMFHIAVFQPECTGSGSCAVACQALRRRAGRAAGNRPCLQRIFARCRQCATGCLIFVERLGASTLEVYIFVASIPLLITGSVLGVLVCLGQASKSGAAEVLTAIVLLSDVLLKLVLFFLVEVTDEMLRREGAKKRAERAERLKSAQLQLEENGGALAFPIWWQRRSARLEGPVNGWKKHLFKMLHYK